ncbi:putative B3 domain-containing protein At3g24850 [Salvia hispanica]|uniref:putative B3 domain-containing protein At3g24850 n=1 Tax=Salvia hispanica TaxID=49212 RepID=UPI002009BC75|nr:putative B3 domain-containing protein At3g24850 [Salvia hispanica]
MLVYRDITKDDLKYDLASDPFEALCIVAERATEIRDREEKAFRDSKRVVEKPIICILPKRPREEAAPVPAPRPKRRRAPPAEEPKKKRVRRPLPPPLREKPPLPAEFHAAIEEMAAAKKAVATEAKLVIQKRLTSTDLSGGHNRLSIPFNDVESDFLTEEEKEHLLGQDEKNKKRFLEVEIVQPSLAVETVKFCRWDMPKENGKTSSTYVIRGKWNEIVHKNDLIVEMAVQLWCFRVDRELCFALVSLAD